MSHDACSVHRHALQQMLLWHSVGQAHGVLLLWTGPGFEFDACSRGCFGANASPTTYSLQDQCQPCNDSAGWAWTFHDVQLLVEAVCVSVASDWLPLMFETSQGSMHHQHVWDPSAFPPSILMPHSWQQLASAIVACNMSKWGCHWAPS